MNASLVQRALRAGYGKKAEDRRPTSPAAVQARICENQRARAAALRALHASSSAYCRDLAAGIA